jgi:hypothetical protein
MMYPVGFGLWRVWVLVPSMMSDEPSVAKERTVPETVILEPRPRV